MVAEEARETKEEAEAMVEKALRGEKAVAA